MAENDGSSSMTGGPEASARQGRYQFLANLALATGSAVIMTGHTADDQVETAFMALMRGRGPGSVAGMTTVSPVPHSPTTTSMVVHDPEVLDGDRTSPFGAVLVRPMLGLSAAVVRTALGDAGIDWREDATNDDLRHPRNRLRHRVLPELEAISPGFRDAFLRSLAISREMAEIAKKAVDDAAANWTPTERGVQMPIRTLLGYTPFAQSALIRSALVRLGADPERIESSHLHAATEMVARGRGRAHLEFADGYRVAVIKGSVAITQVGRSSPGVDGSDLPPVVVNPAP
jgi:tRNA(Ile)-lysidine synthase